MLGLQILPALSCTTCGQLIDAERQRIDSDAAALFGTEPYAWCVECGQQVAPPWTDTYKRLWARRAQVSGSIRWAPER